MVVNLPVLPLVFKAIEKSDIQNLSYCQDSEIRPILPCLVRMSLIAPFDHSEEFIMGRKVILRILSGIEAVNALVALLSIDFTTLEADVKREQSLRQKLGGASQSESILIQGLANGLALEFECTDPTRRLRLLLSELLLVMAQMKEPRSEYYMKFSELFDNECYLEEVSDVLCIALAEFPSLLPPAEVAEALLHLSNGPAIICKMVANQPDCFREVVVGLVSNGEKQDEESSGGMIRLQAVRLLCQMNPSQALSVRTLCIDQCVMPGLAVYITLDVAQTCASNYSARANTSGLEGGRRNSVSNANAGVVGFPSNIGPDDGDIVSFLTGLLLSNEQQQRSWFAQFIKTALRRKFDQPPSALVALRAELVDRLRSLLLFTTSDTLKDTQVIRATALLRLYCALKSLASLKFSEEKEVGLLLQLVTSHPPPTSAGVRFVSTGLCMLIACPSLIATQENERKASEWIKWLVKEEAYFAGGSGVSTSSFGAMLLLMAIHFHLQQFSAIIDLVSAALGMKVVNRASNLAKIKYIFTHDVFTEQVVAAHSVKVPVTKELNSGMPGFLPIHCIYHQLKSRMFTKHKVQIKSWIYNQICQCSTPLHSVMPQLIEVFVTSILVPPTKSGITGPFNEPISEEEIMAIFSLSTFNDKNISSISLRSSERALLRPQIRSGNRIYVRGMQRQNSSNVGSYFSSLNNKGLSCNGNGVSNNNALQVSSVLTSQLLLLYYLLLYEDMRLHNMHQLVSSNRRVHTYSPSLFAQLPIRYLLSNAQREQKLYAGVYSSLLKLLVTHYPQLCLLEDWLYQPPSANHYLAILPPRLALNATSLTESMEDAVSNPGQLMVLLNRMLRLPPHQLWPLAAPLISSIKCLLTSGVPRKIIDTYRLVWLHLNSLFPRRLWAMTVEGLRPDVISRDLRIPLTEDDIVLDPLYVLRCDERAFRCAPILQIVVYVLQVYLLASRTFLTQHIKNNPGSIPAGGQVNGLDDEREKLQGALVLTQESSAIQILLESIIGEDLIENDGESFTLQEVRSIICSFLHQTFIKDTTLAKLVHFQGYSKELVGPLVQGVPSMHVAVGLRWIPELLQLSNLESRLFALELTSHLALQNAMPSTLSTSRLVVNTLSTLLSVLSEKERIYLIENSLVPLVRIGRAFPALLEDLVIVFIHFGRIAASQASLLPAPSPRSIGYYDLDDFRQKEKTSFSAIENANTISTKEDALCLKIRAAFKQLVIESSMSREIY